MDDKYAALLLAAKSGQITEQEIMATADELQKVDPEADRYTLLHILGLSGAKSYRSLVERFLDSKEYPFLAKLALQILCSYWHDTSQYVGQVHRFLRGVSWDETEDCRLTASRIAGEYLRTNSEPTLLKELVAIYENAGERQLLREVAYAALARAMGLTYQEIPSAAHSFDLVTDVDPTVICQAKERIAREL